MIAFLKSLIKRAPVDRTGDFDICHSGNVNKPNVLIFTEHVNATYFISFDIPLKEIHRRGEINFAVASQKLVKSKGIGGLQAWNTSFRPDVVIMTRYGLPHGRQILDYFKQQGTPVIYHIDDNLLEIPHSLGAEIQKVQGAKEVIEERHYLLERCDLIYASTPYLANHLQRLFPVQCVFHGMYAPYMAAHIGEITKPQRDYQIVGYMGSKGHQEDLELATPSIARLLEERPNLHFEVFGTIQMPSDLLRFGERVKSHKVNQAYSGFLATLASLNWDIGLAPLVNESFNLCKAPTKFIEYTAASIPVVASDITVYSRVIPEGGGVLVKDSWYASIARLLDAPELRASNLKTARDFCQIHFSENTLQQQVKQVLSKVM
ncbi:glycosyltransferase family protein [Pseudomonas vlassakiae]|uniref:Glycosyltransferase n=1 Tax=Pseudomonas vlassakiae TaxID=485888 RepID=A0A923GHB1_9PSED|nr:glycosyltransferase [Pseudomonas vlassakiae]MBV4539622.1 glycosyltransferase [Pseudomonas vlassakiae]